MSDDTEKLVRSADFDGPTRHRHCTDVLCLALIMVCWIAMTVIGVYAILEGDYRIVLYPMDYDGNVCGTDFGDIDMTDYPYLYYVNGYTGGVCVADCPTVQRRRNDNNNNSTTNELDNNSTDIVSSTETMESSIDLYSFVTYGGVWQAEERAWLQADFVQVANYSTTPDVLYCNPQDCFPNVDDPLSSWTSTGVRRGYGYAFYAGDTYELLWRCYYTTTAEKEIEQALGLEGDIDIIDNATAIWNRFFADLYTARQYILGVGFGVSVGLSLVYVFFMRLPLLLDLIIWLSIAVSIAACFAGGYYSYELANEWDAEATQTVDDNTITATRGAAVVLYALGGLMVILTVCLRKAIQTAIGCVKQAGRAVNHMFLILLVPILQAICFWIFMLCFIYYSVHLASLGDITSKDLEITDGQAEIAVRVYEFSPFVERCGWYYLFCLFWTANFIVAAGDMMIALAVAHYYFARNKMTIGSWTVLQSVWQVCYYHLGTCAYGSLLIAIVQFIRAIIAKLQREAKRANSKIAQAILCCCQCCFLCLEKCIKFLNKNAYIQTAIFSTPFLKSARRAFYLIVRNAARIAALTYISAAVLIVGKLFISSVTTLIGYYVITEYVDELNSIGGPVAMIFLISYWLSDMFMDVFDMAIATSLQCLIADEEMHDGQGEYCDEKLKRFVDKNATEGDEYEG